ncbi:MAG: hypothetical protein EGQ60_09445 [Clostridiales bacterium]|nr:hypothetical protein [Clostridiales bacterium]
MEGIGQLISVLFHAGKVLAGIEAAALPAELDRDIPGGKRDPNGFIAQLVRYGSTGLRAERKNRTKRHEQNQKETGGRAQPRFPAACFPGFELAGTRSCLYVRPTTFQIKGRGVASAVQLIQDRMHGILIRGFLLE